VTTRYALANHVFVCLESEHVVFLDVRANRYYALERSLSAGLAALVRGWPEGENDCAPRPDIARMLERKGLLIPDSRGSKDATPVQYAVPDTELTATNWEGPVAATYLHVYQFVRSVIAAKVCLRWMPLERAIRKVSRPVGAVEDYDMRSIHELIAIFSRLQPFVFSARDACMLESLALRRFLAAFGYDVTYVIGVQARPFAAHCWLQSGTCVLNDVVDRVIRYTPILTT
jgi:hypothetical protein